MNTAEWIKARVADPPSVMVIRGPNWDSWDVVLRLATGLRDHQTALELAYDRQAELIGATTAPATVDDRRCPAFHSEYRLTCILPPHCGPHFDTAGGHWDATGQLWPPNVAREVLT